MSNTTIPTSKLPKNISRRKKLGLPATQIQINVPTTILRVYAHPLLRFGRKSLDFDIDSSSNLPLREIPLIDLGSIEAKKVRITLRQHVMAKFKHAAALRSCSPEILINSALAEWFNGYWYSNGQPKSFLGICKHIGLNRLMGSYDPEILYCYYGGVFGPPAEAGDTPQWSDPPFEWAVKMRRRYKKY